MLLPAGDRNETRLYAESLGQKSGLGVSSSKGKVGGREVQGRGVDRREEETGRGRGEEKRTGTERKSKKRRGEAEKGAEGEDRRSQKIKKVRGEEKRAKGEESRAKERKAKERGGEGMREETTGEARRGDKGSGLLGSAAASYTPDC